MPKTLPYSAEKGTSMLKLKKDKGFTLIELLIVIVIIGILVAVLIAVINPARARNRAKDAGIEATMSKIALSVQGHISAYGQAPSCDDIASSIDNESNMNTISGPPDGCTFTMSQVSPNTFTYLVSTENDADGYPRDVFWLSTKSIGLSNRDFVMYSGENYSGVLFACDNSSGSITSPSGAELDLCDDLTTQN